MTSISQTDEPLTHATTFETTAETVEQLSPLVRRVVCDNPSPFTFTGTCTYIVGRGTVAIIDPGPERQAHLDALLAATAGERVSHIVLTHTHRDHSPGSRPLAIKTGAAIVGCPAFTAPAGRPSGLDSSHDPDYAPSRVLHDGDRLAGEGWTLEAVTTPGHASNHTAYALIEENALFSGDHVMAWSTSIVAPPDGSMTDYMASIAKLKARGEAIYWPGHGGPVKDPPRYLRALEHHRRLRERSILARLDAGDMTIPTMVERIYENLDPRLKGAAALSVYAHMEDLYARGIVQVEGPLSKDAVFHKV